MTKIVTSNYVSDLLDLSYQAYHPYASAASVCSNLPHQHCDGPLHLESAKSSADLSIPGLKSAKILYHKGPSLSLHLATIGLSGQYTFARGP